MCFGGAKDKSAEIARQEEAKRQRNILKGRGEIDARFKRFNSEFFDRIRQSALDFYMPQAEDQYADAKRTTLLNLARNGISGSSAAARTLGKLAKQDQQARLEIANQASSLRDQSKADYANAKSDLYAQNTAAADPAAAAATAAARADALFAPVAYSPLGQLFGNIVSQAGNAVSAERQGYQGWQTGLFAPKAGGSARVVA